MQRHVGTGPHELGTVGACVVTTGAAGVVAVRVGTRVRAALVTGMAVLVVVSGVAVVVSATTMGTAVGPCVVGSLPEPEPEPLASEPKAKSTTSPSLPEPDPEPDPEPEPDPVGSSVVLSGGMT